MCTKKSFKNNTLYLLTIVFMSAILFSIIGTQTVQAQYLLYYPANAISLYGTPSIFVPPPVPTAFGLPPFNLFYPAIGAPPAVLVPPPTAVNTAAWVTPTASTLLSRIAATAINPVAASSIFSLLSSLAPVTPVAPTSIYNLYYPAVGSVPGTFIAPPAATGLGIFPYNLYYPPGTAPGIPVLPPLP